MHPPQDDLPLSSIILRSYKICCNVCCVILAVHIMFFSQSKAVFFVVCFKILFTPSVDNVISNLLPRSYRVIVTKLWRYKPLAVRGLGTRLRHSSVVHPFLGKFPDPSLNSRYEKTSLFKMTHEDWQPLSAKKHTNVEAVCDWGSKTFQDCFSFAFFYYPKRHVFNLFSLWKFTFTLWS